MKKVKASKAMVQIMKNWGIDHVYGIPGDSIDTVVDALRLESKSIEFIHVRHEEVATLAAAAYSKLTGKIGVALAIGGPGAIHMLNGMYDAKMDHVPMLVLAGQVTSDVKGTGYFQEVDLPALFEDVSVYNRSLESAESIPEILNEAIRTAYEQKGVAVLTVPNDVPLGQIEFELKEESLNFEPTYPDVLEEDLLTASKIINEAQKPVILAGVGTKHAKEELIAFSEHAQIPVMITLPAKGVIPDKHPNFLGNLGKIGTKPSFEAAQETDLLILIGTDYPYKAYLPKNVRCIQLEADPARIGKRHEVTVSLIGDAKESLAKLTAATDKVTDRKFLKACQENMQTWEKWLKEDKAKTSDPIAPEALMAQINAIAEEDTIFSIDVGTATVWSTRYLELGTKNDFIISAWLGTMGCGLPGAIAAKRTYPNRQVISIIGDGGFSMVMQDFATAVGEELPMILIVLNNRQLSFIKYEQQAAGELNYAIDLPNIDYAKFAEACGGIGIKVDKFSELEEAMKTAKQATVPVIIDVAVDTEAAPLPGKIIMDEALGYSKFEVRSVLEDKKFAKMPPLKTIIRRFF